MEVLAWNIGWTPVNPTERKTQKPKSSYISTISGAGASANNSVEFGFKVLISKKEIVLSNRT